MFGDEMSRQKGLKNVRKCLLELLNNFRALDGFKTAPSFKICRFNWT